jgi:hypothetical protein
VIFLHPRFISLLSTAQIFSNGTKCFGVNSGNCFPLFQGVFLSTMESELSCKRSTDSQDEESCPICFLPPCENRKFCSGSCGHRLCVLDAERILLSSTPYATENRLSFLVNEDNLDPYSIAPTLGRCPICRKRMSWFDLIDTEGKLLYEKETELSKWTIAGLQFSERHSLGLSLTFDQTDGPSFSWHEGQNDTDSFQKITIRFQPDCHFHEKSLTFHGEIRFEEKSHQDHWGGVELIRCIFQFSSNLHFVSFGLIMGEGYQVIKTVGLGRHILYSLRPSESKPTYQSNNIWGNTFCQALKIGLASYHFVSKEDVYISYEHPLTSQWPPLDNGSPIPSRAYFREVSWDEHQRLFRGKIKWMDDCGTTWQGFEEWVYEMTFDSKFTFIVSGRVLSLSNELGNSREISNFGSDLIYINAAVGDRFLHLMQEEDSIDILDRFSRLSEALRSDWLSEGASVRVLALLHSVMTRVITGEGSPVDFNLP